MSPTPSTDDATTNDQSTTTNQQLLDQHPKADDLNTALPNDWYLQEKEEYGESLFFAQHPASMRTTNTYEDPEAASKEAHELHQKWINDRASHDDEDRDEGKNSSDGEYTGPMVLGSDDQPERQEDQTREVLDEDDGGYLKITPELEAKAHHAINQIQASILVTAYWMARVYDEKLYAALGCNSKSEFVDRHLPFGHRQARRYAKIGRRLNEFLPNLETGKLPSPKEVKKEEMPESLQGVPLQKLQTLTELDDEDLREYVEEGKWTGPDGQTYTREDVIEMARAELEESVKQKAARLRQTVDDEKDKRQAYEELAEKRKEERDALEEKLEEKSEQIDAAEDLERRLGPTASKLEEKRKTLREAQEHVDEAIRLAGQIGITPNDPEADQQNLQRLLQRALTLQDVLREDYAEVFLELGI